MTDAGVCALARSCPLTITILSGINNLTDASIFTLANCCPYLEEIYLSGCYRVTRTAIRYLQVTLCIIIIISLSRLSVLLSVGLSVYLSLPRGNLPEWVLPCDKGSHQIYTGNIMYYNNKPYPAVFNLFY